MTDYSQLSDFEINHRVAKLIGLKLPSSESLLYNTQGKWEIFDPCCNPADGWPVIELAGIGLMRDVVAKEWVAFSDHILFEGDWQFASDPVHHESGSNPLRAAMIVFLMMKGAENANS